MEDIQKFMARKKENEKMSGALHPETMQATKLFGMAGMAEYNNILNDALSAMEKPNLLKMMGKRIGKE